MARRRSKPKKVRRLGTEELTRQAYASAAMGGPMNGERFGFMSTKNGKVDVCVFRAMFAAKMYLELMIGDDEVEVEDGCLFTSGEVFIKPTSCVDLEEIYNYEVSYEERRYYALGQEYVDRARNIRSNTVRKPFIEGETHKHSTRHSRKGMTLIGEIAAKLGMDARDARSILRSKMPKPEHGWAWRPSEVGRIYAILQGKSANTITIDFSGINDSN